MKTMKLALFLVMAFVLVGTNDASAKRREQQTSIFARTCDRFTDGFNHGFYGSGGGSWSFSPNIVDYCFNHNSFRYVYQGQNYCAYTNEYGCTSYNYNELNLYKAYHGSVEWISSIVIQNQPNTRRGVDIYYEDPEGGYSWGADGDWFAWGGGEVRWGNDLDYIDFNYYDGSTLDWDDDWCNDILDDSNPYYVDSRHSPHKKSKPSKY